MARALDISVVIVNWNSKDDLRECLSSLESQTVRDFETIVVDNGSTDGSLAMLRKEFPHVVLVDAAENLGFAEGCNRGIERASGSWIALLNNDAVAMPEWITNLRTAASVGCARLGMVQSQILFKQDLTKTNSTGIVIGRDGYFIDRDYDRAVVKDRQTEEIFCVSGGAALYSRTMLEEIRLDSGFFDKTFFMYFEDVDLGWRGRLAGWSAVYEPRAVVHHAFHGTAIRRGKNFVRLQCAKNRLRTVLKNASPAYMARTAPRILWEILWSVAHEGPVAVSGYWGAATDGFSQRRAVAKIARLDRRSVERRWCRDARWRPIEKGLRSAGNGQ